MKKTKVIVIVISVVVLLGLVLPIVFDYFNTRDEFKLIETTTKESIDKGVEEADSNFSKYFDIKSLEYDITRIYKTTYLNQLGYEITFSVNSDYSVSYYYSDIEYALMMYDLDDLLKESEKKLDDEEDIYIDQYKLTLIFNGEEVYTDYKGSSYSIYDEFIEHEYKDYGGELKKAKILWEYVDGDIKLKQIPEYIFIVISLLGMILVISIIMICANYYEKHASVNTKVSVGCLGEIIKFLIIYFLIGIFTGGVGFFALPILWLLENRNR